jgi:hypothetical protein
MRSRQITHEKWKIHATFADLGVPSYSQDWCGSPIILIYSDSCDKTEECFTTLSGESVIAVQDDHAESPAIDGAALFKRRDKCVYGVRNRDWSAADIS